MLTSCLLGLCHKLSRNFGWYLLVTNNGTTFTSREFSEFMKECGIVHVMSAPYHHATNGLAQRAVQTLKQGLLKLEGSIQNKLSQFLLSYILTPHATTGITPAKALLSRHSRSRLDLLHPDLSQLIE